MNRILITPRSLTSAPDETLAPLSAAGFEVVFSTAGRHPEEAELKRLLPGCVGWLAGVEPITERTLDAADALRIISRNGVGTDAIDIDALERRGIVLRTTPGANAASVAELTVGLALAGLRAIPRSAAALQAGDWKRWKGREIEGATVGLVGCGAVGQMVARKFLALDASVLAHDPMPDRGFSPSPAFRWASLDEVAAGSDIVSLHCPPPAGDPVVLDARRLAAMKQGAGIVNTARASLIDADALLEALDAGRLDWFAVDVFDTEPPARSRLLAHERVIATPHIGAFTREGQQRAVKAAVDNLLSELTAAREVAR